MDICAGNVYDNDCWTGCGAEHMALSPGVS